MGSWHARFQAKKGRSVAGAAKANEPASSNSTMRILGFIGMIGDSSLCGLVRLLRVERHHAHDAFALFDVDYLIRFDVLQSFYQAAGPAYLQQLHLLRLANPEMHAQIILRKIAAAAAHFIDLRMKSFFVRQMRDALHTRTDAAAIRFCADGLDFDPIVSGA